MKRKWQDVDWVELGCRGWEIDRSGAELVPDPDGMDHAHLDFATLDLILGGSPEFVQRVIDDLRAARLLMREVWAVSQSVTTAASAPTASITFTAPPDDHADFIALRRGGFKALRREMAKRRRAK